MQHSAPTIRDFLNSVHILCNAVCKTSTDIQQMFLKVIIQTVAAMLHVYTINLTYK